MAFKITLLCAFVFQTVAALLALRLNLRYRIYSAWFLIFAAASVGALMRLTTLFETWDNSPSLETGGSLWTSAIASLMAAVFLVAGMALIEPFFQAIARAEETLRREHRQLKSIVRETEEELRLAQRIQRQLLPTSAPRVPELDVYGASQAAEWTSGDYFDYLRLRDGSTAIVIADVAGHGLGPALLMSSTRASFRALAPTVADVGELLTRGNRAVADSVSSKEFVTAFAARYDAGRRVLSHAAAGHAAYLVKGDGSTRVLDGTAPPLGVLPDIKISSREQPSIQTGDVLVLVTDGIMESQDASQEMFGEVRLLETVTADRERSSREIVTALFDASSDFRDGQPQRDDITAVVVKFV